MKKNNEKQEKINIYNLKESLIIKDFIPINFEGVTRNIKRIINEDINFNLKYIKIIEECIELGEDTIEELKKPSIDSIFETDFEFWSNIFIKIINNLKKIYVKYQDIKTWNSSQRLKLCFVILYEIIFNYYYKLYLTENLKDDDKKLLKYIFSDEGKIAVKRIYNATISVFNEIDTNQDGEISCKELKDCCCTPSKYCSIFKSCFK